MDEDYLCQYCNHPDYIIIGGQSAVGSRRHKKPETRVDAVDSVKLHDLKRQETFLLVIRHIIIQKERWRIVLFPFLITSDSKILGMMENKVFFKRKLQKR